MMQRWSWIQLRNSGEGSKRMFGLTKVSAVVVLMVVVAGGFASARAAEATAQVMVEARFITVPTKSIPAEMLDPVKREFRLGDITPEQARKLEQVAGSAGSVVSVPRVTVADGGKAQVSVATETKYTDLDGAGGTKLETVWDGVKLDAAAKVSKDGKYIRLQLRPVLQKLLKMEDMEITPEGRGPVKFQQPMLQTIDLTTDVNVPDGQYLCLGGQAIAGEAEAKDESTLLVLVRAKIVAPKGEAEVKPR
ncbi:MAG TPA: hypothetical protein VHP11_14585 [Tepidisphaeraceae bacterium]|nr:hypothetical protein [Tepidisphaeraceae bacterium]